MIHLVQTISRAPFAACPPIASNTPASAEAREEAEYQTVYAFTAALLAVGVVVAITALTHAAGF